MYVVWTFTVEIKLDQREVTDVSSVGMALQGGELFINHKDAEPLLDLPRPKSEYLAAPAYTWKKYSIFGLL